MNNESVKKIFMTKASSDEPWGFSIQGGVDFGEPLTIYKIQPDSPASTKLASGYAIKEIAGKQTDKMTHEDAIMLIKKCHNSLLLTVETIDEENEDVVDTTTSMVGEGKNEKFEQDESATPATFVVPEPPPLNALYMRQRYLKSMTDCSNPSPTETFAENRTACKVNEETRIPERLLSTMTKPGMKPFTYTPRGIDLDEVMEKARERIRSHRRQHESEDIGDKSSSKHQNPSTTYDAGNDNKMAMRSSYYDTGAVTHSKSFQRLQGWIDNSEQQAYDDGYGTENIAERKNAAKVESIPSKAFSKLQETYKSTSNPMTGMKRQTDNISMHRSVPAKEMAVPARDRDHEPEAHKFTGCSIPSKSFKQLERFMIPSSTKAVHTHANQSCADFGSSEQRWKSTVPSKSFRLLQQLSGMSENK